MNAEKRRERIVELLKKEERPISASALAKEFGVSRQVIVGDVALLRATGELITSTARGYVLEKAEENVIYEVLFCKHSIEDTEKELNLIVDYGGEVMNTMIEHPIYGTITASLKLKDRYEVKEFIKKQQKYGSGFMSQMTGGYHAHMVRCHSKEALERIKNALRQEEILEDLESLER